MAFPETRGLTQEDRQRLREASQADLKRQGPRIEVARATLPSGPSSIYLATNIPDGALFDLAILPISSTIIGEAQASPPLRLQTEKHLAHSPEQTFVPGYYWAMVSPADEQPSEAAPWISSLPKVVADIVQPFEKSRSVVLVRKLFLGGEPDSSYQSHLASYASVKRGTARAELEKLQNAAAKMDALLNSESQAALTLSGLKIENAKAQAWEIFQSTWTQQWMEIQTLLATPVHFTGTAEKAALAISDSLKKLHEHDQSLVHSGTAKGESSFNSQLAPGSVATARILAESQALSSEISSQLQGMRSQLDLFGKNLENPLFLLPDEPFTP